MKYTPIEGFRHCWADYLNSKPVKKALEASFNDAVKTGVHTDNIFNRNVVHSIIEGFYDANPYYCIPNVRAQRDLIEEQAEMVINKAKTALVPIIDKTASPKLVEKVTVGEVLGHYGKKAGKELIKLMTKTVFPQLPAQMPLAPNTMNNLKISLIGTANETDRMDRNMKKSIAEAMRTRPVEEEFVYGVICKEFPILRGIGPENMKQGIRNITGGAPTDTVALLSNPAFVKWMIFEAENQVTKFSAFAKSNCAEVAWNQTGTGYSEKAKVPETFRALEEQIQMLHMFENLPSEVITERLLQAVRSVTPSMPSHSPVLSSSSDMLLPPYPRASLNSSSDDLSASQVPPLSSSSSIVTPVEPFPQTSSSNSSNDSTLEPQVLPKKSGKKINPYDPCRRAGRWGNWRGATDPGYLPPSITPLSYGPSDPVIESSGMSSSNNTNFDYQSSLSRMESAPSVTRRKWTTTTPLSKPVAETNVVLEKKDSSSDLGTPRSSTESFTDKEQKRRDSQDFDRDKGGSGNVING